MRWLAYSAMRVTRVRGMHRGVPAWHSAHLEFSSSGTFLLLSWASLTIFSIHFCSLGLIPTWLPLSSLPWRQHAHERIWNHFKSEIQNRKISPTILTPYLFLTEKVTLLAPTHSSSFAEWQMQDSFSLWTSKSNSSFELPRCLLLHKQELDVWHCVYWLMKWKMIQAPIPNMNHSFQIWTIPTDGSIQYNE